MIGLAALVLISTATQTGAGPHRIPLLVASLGDNLTLTCPISGDRAGLFYWYKMKVGYMIQTVAKGLREKTPEIVEGFNNGRFTASVGVEYTLSIADVCKEDEGIYICQSGSVYEVTMTNATILHVRDPPRLQDLITVKQDPGSETFQADTKVNLQCSLIFSNQADKTQCFGEHQCPSVHWFRAGLEQSDASRIYTTNSSATDGKSCDYNLSGSLDEGMYYCAVATCGKILFGKGTRVEIRLQQLHLAVVIAVPLLCCVIIITVVIKARNKKGSNVCRHNDGANDMNQRELYRADQVASNVIFQEDEDGVNYAALNFSTRQREKRLASREQPQVQNSTCTS